MELETLKVCIDGVDCSGKTTLWNSIHKSSGYRWKLEDRSFVTMVVYARLYGRKKIDDYARQLQDDLNNLNNKYVLIDPSWELVEQRYKVRGDDLHDFDAMVKIHSLYHEVIEEIKKRPNVLVLDGSEDSMIAAKKVHEWILSQDQTDLNGIIKLVQGAAAASPNGEASPLRFSFMDDGRFSSDETRILDHKYVSEFFPAVKPATVEEFNKMVEEFDKTIDDELKGNNLYGKPQTNSSRRFVFTQQACVSFIQAMVRDGIFKFHVTCRSSHVYDVFPADIRLMYHMAQRAFKKMGLNPETKVIFNFTLNSAHTVF